MDTTFWALVGPLYQQSGGRRPQVRTGFVQRLAPFEITAGRFCRPTVGVVGRKLNPKTHVLWS